MKHIHAILPRLISKVGHIFHYHISVQKSVELIDWDYTAYIPQKAQISPLPFSWQPILANDIAEHPKTFWQTLRIIFANILPFRRIIQTIKNNESAVLFIEHFELQHLLSLALASLFLKSRFQFWMLFRYEFEDRKLKIGGCRAFLQFMYWKLGKKNVKLLTDSELLREVLEKDLGRVVSVVPIPHAEGEPIANKKTGKEIQFWWPGGLIREDKGLSKIHYLLKTLENHQNVQLVVADQAREILGAHPNLCFIPTVLSRQAYLEWMQIADLILLPYSGQAYSKRTSGIFVEAVSLGSIPVVTKGTWMAYELERFDLAELTFDWKEPDLLVRLCHLLTDPIVENKLAKMRSQYRNFHCFRGFCKSLEQLTHF